jgi:vitamin-K-epoxide reductase (warfarin-sensitive)
MSSPQSIKAALTGLGLILSLYAVYVEHKMEHLAEHDEEFTALCDIPSIGASCSTVFTLPVGKLLSYFGMVPKGSLLDVPNAMLGAIFYAVQLLVPSLPPAVNTVMVCCAMASSVFLAYQLTFVLGDLCLLCWSTHVINSTLFYQTVLARVPSKKKVA